MSKRHPKLLLGDILDSAEKIFLYTQSLTYEELMWALRDTHLRGLVLEIQNILNSNSI